MTFLVPFAWFMIALAGPVLLFYLIRQRPRLRPVTSLLFWREFDSQVYNKPLWRRLRNWLSYLLQVLFILLLVAALSRPVWTHLLRERKASILIIDASPSMLARMPGEQEQLAQYHENSPTRWDVSINHAIQYIDDFRGNDSGLLILTGEPPRVLQGWTQNRRKLKESLEAQVFPSDPSESLLPALELAANLREINGSADIILFSDRIWKSTPQTDDWLKGITVVDPAFEARMPSGNSGVTVFSARRSLSEAGRFLLMAEICNSNQIAVTGKLLVYRNEKLHDAREVTIPAGNAYTHRWSDYSRESLAYRIVWKSEDEDALETDNLAELHLQPLETVNVVIHGAVNSFLLTLLGTIPETRVFTADNFSSGAADGPVCHIYYREMPESITPGQASLLFIPDGNGFWGELIGNENQPPVVARLLENHPVLEYADLRNIRMRQAVKYKPAADAVILAESPGVPLIFGQWQQSSAPWLVFAFDLNQTDMPLRTAFPIIFGNIVQSLRPLPEGMKADLPGRSESSLVPYVADESAPIEIVARPNLSSGNASVPIWWWLVLAGGAWCLLEWWLYSRRITE